MAASNKTNVRAPGRTPPFILIILLLILAFLSYSYWSLSSTNAELFAELGTVRIQKQDADMINSDSEKKIAKTKSDLSEAQEHLNQAKKQLQDKESELANVKTDLSIKVADIEKSRNQLSQCDASLAEFKSSVDVLKNEKAQLEKLLQEEKAKPVVCDMMSCKAPVRDILTIAAKLVGSDALGKALSGANLDVGALMEGIQVPAPAVNQQQQQAPNQQQQAANQQAANQNPLGKGNQVESNTAEKNKETIKTMNVTGSLGNASQTDANKKTNASLEFHSERDKNIAEISKQFGNVKSKEAGEGQSENEVNKKANASDIVTTGRISESTVDIDAETDNENADDKMGADEKKEVKKRKTDNIELEEKVDN